MMKIRFPALGLVLALPLLLSTSDIAAAQAEQDTAQMRRGRGMHRGAAMGHRGHQFMRGGHAGPRALIGVKDDLGLSEDQVAQLEKVHEGHHALMQAQMKRLAEHREGMRKAKAEGDWDALESGIEEGANLQAGMARGLLNVQRQSLEVLTDEQRTKFETWQEGVRMYWRQRFDRRQGMRGQGMRRGQRMQRHQQPPPQKPQS
jgi:Spy/CpxP family protein refolding chaperone